MSEEVLSKSKQKREARKEENKKAKSKKNLDAVIGWIIGVVIAATIIGVIVAGIISSVTKTTTESGRDYSYGLTTEGYVKGADLSKVTDLDLDALVVPFSEVECTDEDVENTISSILSANKYFDNNKTLKVQDGDIVSIDYVGYVDDVAFEGGNTMGEGTTLEIGSKSYIDTFEEQLIGARPGDKVTVNVTFPDPYTPNPDLAGKAARFDVEVHGIQKTPEFTDEFVKEHLSEDALTTEEYRAFVKKTTYESNVENYIATYINSNAKATKVPNDYLANLRSLIKFYDEQSYKYQNQFYYSYFGSYIYSSFSDYTGKTDDEYEKYLVESAKEQAAAALTYEKYFKDNNLTVSAEQMDTVLEAYGEDAVETYGAEYIQQIAVKYAVIKHLGSVVKVQ